MAEAGSSAARGFLDGAAEIGARGLKRRKETEQNAGRHGESEREQHHPEIHRYGVALQPDARDIPGIQAQNAANARESEHQPEHPAGDRQDHAFGEQLANDSSASGSDSGADRDFPPASCRARQQKIGDVRACDQQHEAHRAQQNPEKRAHPAHQHFTQRLHTKGPLRTQAVRIALPKTLGRRLELLVRGHQAHARLQAPGHLEVIPLIGTVRIQPEGNVDVRWLVDLDLQAGACHSDDFMRTSAQRDGLADHVGIRTETALPESVSQHRDIAPAGKIFFLREGSAVDRRGPEQGKEIRAGLGFLNLLRQIARLVVRDAESPGRHVLERLGLGAPEVELDGRSAGPGALRRHVHEHDNPLGIGEVHRLEQNRVDEGKDGGIGPHAERQCEDGGDRERRSLEEHPDGVLQVLKKRSHAPLLQKEYVHPGERFPKKRTPGEVSLPRRS